MLTKASTHSFVSPPMYVFSLAQSEYRDNFIIKGGILVTAMIGVAHRSTMDIDTSLKNLNLSAEDLLDKH